MKAKIIKNGFCCSNEENENKLLWKLPTVTKGFDNFTGKQ